MIICGLKLTHDGAIALIDNGKLVFCYEMEKLNNSPRYSNLHLNFETICGFLNAHGCNLEDVDQIVIDGWGDELGFNTDKEEEYTMPVDLGKGSFTLRFAEYGYIIHDENLLERKEFNYPEQGLSYSSYRHASGHIMAAYCTSPFAKRKEDSFVLGWDGGMVPQLFYYHWRDNKIENLGPIFLLMGYIYQRFAMKFKPYDHLPLSDLTVAGKVMAYIALGKVQDELLKEFRKIYREQNDEFADVTMTPVISRAYTQVLLTRFVEYGKAHGWTGEDMMASFHYFLQELLIKGLEEKVKNYPAYAKNLCFAGGCALNIKWNSAIRGSGIFKEMWVPPFPNDSGSAVGTACCEMIERTHINSLDWNVYSGPPLIDNQEQAPASWTKRPYSLKELARLLHETSEPVVFLNGRAELGPRALGNRSILAAAVDKSMKDHLNKIKERAYYRPVAPICLEEDAPKIFNPGIPDPLMLYDHDVRDGWKDKIPAVCHLDGSSRVQTVNRRENSEIYELLTEYKKLSGIPLLCNTSANLKGRGFFPDVRSALEWEQVNFVWTNHTLYIKKGCEKSVK
ncbi:MAG: hypothetical protein L0Y73_07335 [Candidatus Aminicenantes bacterium]|nr:hypothetical protein [Candidatus Aminicenantes bacterium]